MKLPQCDRDAKGPRVLALPLSGASCCACQGGHSLWEGPRRWPWSGQDLHVARVALPYRSSPAWSKGLDQFPNSGPPDRQALGFSLPKPFPPLPGGIRPNSDGALDGHCLARPFPVCQSKDSQSHLCREPAMPGGGGEGEVASGVPKASAIEQYGQVSSALSTTPHLQPSPCVITQSVRTAASARMNVALQCVCAKPDTQGPPARQVSGCLATGVGLWEIGVRAPLTPSPASAAHRRGRVQL